MEIYYKISYIAFPAIMCNFFAVLQDSLNLIIAGQLKDEDKFTGVGLGISINMIFGVAMFLGLNQALSTFVSQAVGAKHIEICGVYLWRARYTLIGFLILLSPIQIFTEQILLRLGQDPEVSYWAWIYSILFFPGLVFQGLLDIDRNFLTSFERSDICMKCQIFSPIIHGFICYSFTILFDLGVFGCGLSGFVTNFIIFIVQNRELRKVKSCEAALDVRYNDPRNFKNMAEYLKLAIPSTLFIMIEWSVFDIMSIMAGTLGVSKQACQLILMNITNLVFTISLGIQSAASTLIGHQIGDNNIPMAKLYFKHTFVFACIILVIQEAVLILTQNMIQKIFTSNAEVISLFKQYYWIAIIEMAIDYFQGVLAGVVRALGKQDIFAAINIVSYYCLALPLAIYLCFKLELGILGLWIGLICGIINQILFQIGVIFKSDWSKIAEEAQVRLQNEAQVVCSDSYEPIQDKMEDVGKAESSCDNSFNRS